MKPKFKRGDIVKHILTREGLLILDIDGKEFKGM